MIFIVWFFISWGIRAFGREMIVFLTSITSHSIAIGTDPGVRLGPRFFSSPWDGSIIISISTPTSIIVIIVIFISIPTLTSVSKSPLGILSVIWSCITLSIVILIIITPIT